MPAQRFPDPLQARGDIVAVGDDLDVDTLIEAYGKGIFPWPMEELQLPWFSPRRRAILHFEEIHLSRSLQRAVRQNTFLFTVDRAFREVMKGCAETPRPGQDGTWILPEILEAYGLLHDRGVAHSVEVWEAEALVGGIYGVDCGGAFTGESMFYRRPNASKLALLHLVDHLRSQGLDWLDIQVMTPHMSALGAREIARREFLVKLKTAQSAGKALVWS